MFEEVKGKDLEAIDGGVAPVVVIAAGAACGYLAYKFVDGYLDAREGH